MPPAFLAAAAYVYYYDSTTARCGFYGTDEYLDVKYIRIGGVQG